MRRLFGLVFICSVISAHCVASPSCPGPYAGIQLAGGADHFRLPMMGLQQGNVHYEGFAERGYIGYQFNSNLGLEVGAVHFTPGRVHLINGTTKNGTIKDYNFDALFAGTLAFNNGYYVFGKFGVGYHLAEPSQHIRSVSTSDYANRQVGHYRPELMAGAGYAITHRIGLDASYTRIISERMLPGGTLWSLGITYRFQDFYPGKTLFS